MMQTHYLLGVFCVVQIPLISGAFERFSNFWVKEFSQLKDCVPTPVYATCNMMPDPAAPFNLSGTVDFLQLDYCGKYLGPLNVKTSLKGFPREQRRRKRGFHVHEFADISAGCDGAGAHFDPYHLIHGAPYDKMRHAGDFGNIPVRSDGSVAFALRDRVANLSGKISILGRAVVVHAGTDDEGRGGDAESKKTGNAGARLACCVIALKDGPGSMG